MKQTDEYLARNTHLVTGIYGRVRRLNASAMEKSGRWQGETS